LYLLDVDEMFVCVNSLPVACWTSHVASPVGAFYFSFAKLVQAAFCKYWSLAPDSCTKYRQPSAFSSSRQVVAKENVVFQDFAGNSLHLHTFSLPTSEAM
jgi:hypothetical protein